MPSWSGLTLLTYMQWYQLVPHKWKCFSKQKNKSATSTFFQCRTWALAARSERAITDALQHTVEHSQRPHWFTPDKLNLKPIYPFRKFSFYWERQISIMCFASHFPFNESNFFGSVRCFCHTFRSLCQIDDMPKDGALTSWMDTNAKETYAIKICLSHPFVLVCVHILQQQISEWPLLSASSTHRKRSEHV